MNGLGTLDFFGIDSFGDPGEVYVHVCFDLGAFQISNLKPTAGSPLRVIDVVEFDLQGIPPHFSVVVQLDAGGGVPVEEIAYRNLNGVAEFVGYYKNARSSIVDTGGGVSHVVLYRAGGWRSSPSIYVMASEN